MAGDNSDLSAGYCKNSSAYYDRPDHSTLSDINPDFNYLNSIKESINSNYYNETTFKNKYKSNSNFSLLHLNIRSMGARRNFSRGGQTFGGDPQKICEGGPPIFFRQALKYAYRGGGQF